MPHSPKPFFKQSRNTWYVEVNRVQHVLGKHPEGMPPPAKVRGEWQVPDAILALFYRKMAALSDTSASPVMAERDGTSLTVLGIIERFLAWCEDHRAADTYEWYRWRLQSFADTLDRSLTATRIRPFHIDEAMARHPRWSSTMKRGFAQAIQRVFRWAKKKGYIDTNPVADYEKARPGKRKVILSQAEFEILLQFAKSDEFRDLLIFTWETAARPQESLILEARHLDLAGGRIVLPEEEAKGEQWPRVIFLTSRATEIVTRRMSAYPEGPLFRNSDGAPWTTYAVNCAFGRIQQRIGRRKLKELGLEPPPITAPKCSTACHSEPAVARRERDGMLRQRQKQLSQLARKHAKKHCLYHFRHSWLDRALKRGVDALTCAILMGHRDPSTLARTYQHLCQSPDYLAAQARKAVE